MEQSDNVDKKKKGFFKQIAHFLTFFVILAIGNVLGSYFVDSYFADSRLGVTEAKLNKTVEEMRKNLPMRIDSDTELTTVFVIDKKIVYNYRLINYTSRQVDATTLSNALRPQLINNYCTNPSLNEFRQANVLMEYNYSDNTGVHITSITVRPSLCN